MKFNTGNNYGISTKPPKKYNCITIKERNIENQKVTVPKVYIGTLGGPTRAARF